MSEYTGHIDKIEEKFARLIDKMLREIPNETCKEEGMYEEIENMKHHWHCIRELIEGEDTLYNNGFEDGEESGRELGYNDGFEDGVEITETTNACLRNYISDVIEDICTSCPIGAFKSYHFSYHQHMCDCKDYKGKCAIAQMRYDDEELS